MALFALLVPLSAALAHEGEGLPVGDGKVSTSPRAGYIYSCQQHFFGNGARHSGDWLDGDTWYPDEKPHVGGAQEWPSSQVSVSVEDGMRVIRANNLPEHATGNFPIRRSDPAYRYDTNPNAISAQNILLKLPLMPQEAAQPSCVPMGMIGFTLDGVALFNGLDAAGRDAAAHEVQDKCDGHPERSGQYHYHSNSPCLRDDDGAAGRPSDLVGYALDGFGIYGMHGDDGKILHDKDLDACHGHVSKVMWNGKMQEIYHYNITPEYPYIIGCFKGTPVSRGQRGGMGRNDDMRGGGNGDPHRQIMEEAARTLGVDFHRLQKAVGPPPPDFGRAARELGISEEDVRNAFENARRNAGMR
ncbi:MAG: YHYH protein [Alphaproteobacteria bacterium]|nr:YHYH protein [Alphaproteobacteria bacterium]